MIENVLFSQTGICSMELGISLVLRKIFKHNGDDLIKHRKSVK